ncbi:MAG TPA: DUF202 domain-containing protein [Actinopolymorphaceae bacterium]
MESPTGAEDQGRGGSVPPGEPDYRFTLANERTFLAYLRTALAIDAAGIAVVEFVEALGTPWVRRGLGIVLAVAGILLGLGGYLRWNANLAAMRAGAPLPKTFLPLGLAAAVLVVSGVALYLVVFG